MRRNAKWSLAGYGDGGEEGATDPLLDGLRALRRKLHTWRDLASVPPLEYLTPFLDICRSEAEPRPLALS